MNRINIKPLSVNCAFKGRRFKTPEYKAYEKSVLTILPKITVPDGKLKLTLEFAFSNAAADIDNPAKLLIDIMQKKFGFNDNRIYELVIKKTIVKKKNEFIEFNFEKIG